MQYLSLFSGVGGLEGEASSPEVCCEIDETCWTVLRRRFPGVDLHPDIRTLRPPAVDVVAGGWPCQDISIAGLKRGLAGQRSGLFYELLRVAEEAGAHTIVAENVPHLLALHRGQTFDLVLRALEASGFRFVAWRTLNARAFGLPHERKRVFIIASRHRELALSLHRPLPECTEMADPDGEAVAAFYWTAGIQSICYSRGFVPTLKVGSALTIPSPPALHFDGVVRQARPLECVRLQGFDPGHFQGIQAKHVYRMMGNAVAAPVGRFVFQCLEQASLAEPTFAGFGYTADSGFYEEGMARTVKHVAPALATNLHQYVDLQDRDPISARAAAGLLSRLQRSGKPCPPEVRELLLPRASGWQDADVEQEDEEDDVSVLEREEGLATDNTDAQAARDQLVLF